MYTALAAVFSFVWTAVPFVGSHSPCAPGLLAGGFFLYTNFVLHVDRGNVGFFDRFTCFHYYPLVPHFDILTLICHGIRGKAIRVDVHSAPIDEGVFPICMFWR